MGSRHNRKRTRSRPRHRNRSLCNQLLSFDSMSAPPPLPQPLPSQASFALSSCSSGPHSYTAWNDGVWLRHQRMSVGTPFSEASSNSKPLPAQQLVKPVDDKHLRVFGGEPEDGMALCDSMVQVLLDLFDGSVDYEDDDVVIGLS